MCSCNTPEHKALVPRVVKSLAITFLDLKKSDNIALYCVILSPEKIISINKLVHKQGNQFHSHFIVKFQDNIVHNMQYVGHGEAWSSSEPPASFFFLLKNVPESL